MENDTPALDIVGMSEDAIEEDVGQLDLDFDRPVFKQRSAAITRLLIVDDEDDEDEDKNEKESIQHSSVRIKARPKAPTKPSERLLRSQAVAIKVLD